MPHSDSGKAIASRNATTHGLFARDVVLPALGEDSEGYRQLEAQWMAQLRPGNLLERHYVEKIAAASWRLRRFHRWQAQIFENSSLTESERLDRLGKTLRHEAALPALANPEGRQIDAAVKMLNKEAVNVELKVQDRLRRLRMDTAETDAPEVDKSPKPCENEPGELLAAVPQDWGGGAVPPNGGGGAGDAQNCQNELSALIRSPFRWSEYLDPNHRHHPAPRFFHRHALGAA